MRWSVDAGVLDERALDEAVLEIDPRRRGLLSFEHFLALVDLVNDVYLEHEQERELREALGDHLDDLDED